MTLQVPADDRLVDLPPSAKLVYLVLEDAGETTQADLRDRTQLPQRTVRTALNQLVDAGVVDRRPRPGDARQHLYQISDD